MKEGSSGHWRKWKQDAELGTVEREEAKRRLEGFDLESLHLETWNLYLLKK